MNLRKEVSSSNPEQIPYPPRNVKRCVKSEGKKLHIKIIYATSTFCSCGFCLFVTGLLPGHLFSSKEMAEGRSKISSALHRLALEIPLDLYCVIFTNIIERTWEWVQLPIINTLCQYRLTFQSVMFRIYSITRNSPTLKLKLSFGTNFLSNFLKGTTR